MATFPVKWFSSEMQGSPQLSSTYESTGGSWDSSAPYESNYVKGQVVSMLKAYLIDGFGDTTPTSITYDSAADRVTVEFGVVHYFKKHSVIKIEGADQAPYNGEFRVTKVLATSFEYQPDTAPGSATATTSTAFNCLIPACDGWEIIDDDSANFRMVIGRTAADATPFKMIIRNDQNYQWVDFTQTSWVNQGIVACKIEVVDNFVDYESYDFIENYYVPASASHYQFTNSNPDSTSYWDQKKPFYFYADSHCFYWLANMGYQGERCALFFGDIISARPGDRGHFMGVGYDPKGPNFDTTNWSGGPSFIHKETTPSLTGDPTLVSVRGYPTFATDYANNIGATKAIVKTPFTSQFHEGQMLDYPNPANSGLYLSQEKSLVMEYPNNEISTVSTNENKMILRGFLPGYLSCMQNPINLDGKFLEGMPGFAGAIVAANYTFGRSASYSTYLYGDYVHFTRLDQWRDNP